MIECIQILFPSIESERTQEPSIKAPDPHAKTTVQASGVSNVRKERRAEGETNKDRDKNRPDI